MSKSSKPEALQELNSWVLDVIRNRELHLEFYYYLKALPYGTIEFVDLAAIFGEVAEFAPDVALQLLKYMTEQEQYLWEAQHPEC